MGGGREGNRGFRGKKAVQGDLNLVSRRKVGFDWPTLNCAMEVRGP